MPVLFSRLSPGGDHRRGIPGVREKHCISVAMEMKISTITIVFCFKASQSSVLTPSPTLPLLQFCPSYIPAHLTDFWDRNWRGNGRTHKSLKSGQGPEKEKKVVEGLVEWGDDKKKLEKGKEKKNCKRQGYGKIAFEKIGKYFGTIWLPSTIP